MVKEIIEKYIYDDKKTVLYITNQDNLTLTYEKDQYAQYSWVDAIKDYGHQEYTNYYADGYVLDIQL